MSQIIPFSLRNTPALIEQLLPVQKLSVESFKEQMAASGKTLTAIGSYWKGRKPLILNKACVLGCLLPATTDPKRDIEVFEMLMGMDDESFVVRLPKRPQPREILEKTALKSIANYFVAVPAGVLPDNGPVDWANPEYKDVRVSWRPDLPEWDRRHIEAGLLPKSPYRERVDKARRSEEVSAIVHNHIWDSVNEHLGTNAQSFPDLVEQLGIMRFGHRPRVADTFCGSGQIPFEAARLGCDVYASDLNPIACMLTWGAFHIVGGSQSEREQLAADQKKLVTQVKAQLDELAVETDGNGWEPRAFLYCLEVQCPQSGWKVPLLPSRIISVKDNTILELIPNPKLKQFDIRVKTGASEMEMTEATKGTILRDSRYEEAYLSYSVNKTDYKAKISTLRGEYQKSDGSAGNRIRAWSKQDFKPQSGDIFQERLYAILWMHRNQTSNRMECVFRSVTDEDMARERKVEAFVGRHIEQWQKDGLIPDMRIEIGGPPRYQGQDLVRARGWTYWHHAFTPRMLLMGALIRSQITASTAPGFAALLNCNSKLSRWHPGSRSVVETFDNQALNTLYNYACQSFAFGSRYFSADRFNSYAVAGKTVLTAAPATQVEHGADVFITDPPYGDAVKYEEILDFFVAWLRKNPPPEFRNWVWDSRRALAIKGEDENFRQGMVAAYKGMCERMSGEGIQVIMFTHQSGSIWADMSNIVWASGLQVTAAWYVVTETDSALREGSNVKGTIILVLRKRKGAFKTNRDDLAWEIQEEVENQVKALTGLNQEAKGNYRDENVFEDADIQMAGYAAALRVLTRYAIIDGREMATEAIRPRVKGENTFVDGLIAFAVDTANQCLVPKGILKAHWDGFNGVERFYLKLLDLEAKGIKTLDNYQNFAKAFKVRDFRAMMASEKANQARLKSAVEFGRGEMSDGSEFYRANPESISPVRAVLYALMEIQKNTDITDVIAHLALNVSNYYDTTQREIIVELADYIARKVETLRPDEASAARVLRDAVQTQTLG